MGEERVRRYETLSDLIASFPKEEASEWYFARLMEYEDAKDAIENKPVEGEEGEETGEESDEDESSEESGE